MTSYRDAAIALWGAAGAYVHDSYARMREMYLPDLPPGVPIVIGITAYGHCDGLTRGWWEHGPRITIASNLFGAGTRLVDDVMIHEMLHVWLRRQGQPTAHDSEAWYAAVRRLSPLVLGHEWDVRRGGARRSVRVANRYREPGVDDRKTVVRKVSVEGAVPHAVVATWPGSVRPPDMDRGQPMDCPTY